MAISINQTEDPKSSNCVAALLSSRYCCLEALSTDTMKSSQGIKKTKTSCNLLQLASRKFRKFSKTVHKKEKAVQTSSFVPQTPIMSIHQLNYQNFTSGFQQLSNNTLCHSYSTLPLGNHNNSRKTPHMGVQSKQLHSFYSIPYPQSTPQSHAYQKK